MTQGIQPEVICRAAGDKTKGFRFQKIRACIRLLERISVRPDGQIYCAMEFLEDSVVIDEDAPNAVSAEENKLYTTPLTFNSKAIRNTIVAFLDLDAVFMHEGSLGLAVYASAPLGDEAVSQDVRDRAGAPESSAKYQILRRLVDNNKLTDEEIAIARTIILDEYKDQYSNSIKGRLDILKAWSERQFRDFLERIEWSINADTNESLKTKALDLVRSCRFFNFRHENLEVFIFTSIMDLLEERSQSKKLIDKMVGTADIELLYLQSAAGRSDKPLDPACNAGSIDQPSDKRNISEKILAVSSGYSQFKIKKIQRRIGIAKHESQTFDREYVSLRHRVLDACEDELEKQAESLTGKMTPEAVDALLASLTDRAEERMTALSSSYSYRIKDREIIKGAVLTLFDDCFLALDEAPEKNG